MPKGLFKSIHHSFFAKHWSKLLLLVLVIGLFLFSPFARITSTQSATAGSLTRLLPFLPPTPAPYPVKTSEYEPGNEVSANSVVVYDLESGVTLYGRNTESMLSPASTTKIMTALVTLEKFQLDDVVTVQTVASDGMLMELVPGEQITIENLLYGALIQSGNDAAWALAEYYPGGVEKFVEAMNAKAAELHLTQTHFTNPVGYDDPAHKMTAMDLTRLAAYSLSNKTIAKMVAIPQIVVSDVTHTYFHTLTNVNELLGKIPGVGGIKTGWTEDAGENLVTLVERDGHRIVIVVLKSQDRFYDTEQLINWVYANHQWLDVEKP
jgi:D-alanyl-D-alanine carboxypeptidase (penicillin-binding protein 5/6)